MFCNKFKDTTIVTMNDSHKPNNLNSLTLNTVTWKGYPYSISCKRFQEKFQEKLKELEILQHVS